MADFLADLLPIRRILVDGDKQPGVVDVNFDSSSLSTTISTDGSMITIGAGGASDALLADTLTCTTSVTTPLVTSTGNLILTTSAVETDIRLTPVSGGEIELNCSIIRLGNGAYSQFVSSRYTCSHSTSGIWCDWNAPQLEGILGYSQELRFGGTVAEKHLGLHGRLPSEIQPAGDLTTLLASLARSGVIENVSKGYVVAIVGDSLWSILATTPANRAARVLEGLCPLAQIEALSIPGGAATSPAHSYRTAPSAGKAIALLTYGINNFIGGQSDATMRTAYAAEVTALLAAGYDEVIASTVVKAGTTTLSVGQNAERLTFNTWLNANFAGLGCVSVIDTAAAANLTDPTNATYFQADQLHFTNAGHTAYATAFQTGINARLTGQTLADSNIAGNAVNIDATTVFDVDAATVDFTTTGTQTYSANGGVSSLSISSGFFIRALTSLMLVSADQHYLQATNTRQHRRTDVPVDTATTNATVTTAYTFATVSNTVYRVRVCGAIANDTDNEAGSFEPRSATFKNIAGTVTQVGAVTPAAPEDHLDATLATAAITWDFSGTSLRVRVTGVAAKNITWRLIVDIEEVPIV